MQISRFSRAYALKLARAAALAALKNEPPPDAADAPDDLLQPGGCFVTLKNRGRLRGCLGTFETDRPVIEQIIRMAGESATRDYRFAADPVTSAEMAALDLEISVLSPPVETDDPLSIELGVHGIEVIGADGRRGVYLPQVATEHHMTKEEFLSSCCSHKAGLAPEAWKDPAKCTVYTFTATVFGEKSGLGAV